MSSAIGLIQGAHAVIAGLSRQGHWFINDADARRYGQAMANAARHFPLRATQKAIDVTMLIITAVSIEAPRIALSMQIARGVRPMPQQRGPAQVFHFTPNATAGPPQAERASAAPSSVAADAPPDMSSDQGAIGGEPAA